MQERLDIRCDDGVLEIVVEAGARYMDEAQNLIRATDYCLDRTCHGLGVRIQENIRAAWPRKEVTVHLRKASLPESGSMDA